MKPENNRILMVYTSLSTFVANDALILAEKNHVDKYQFFLSNKLNIWVWQFIAQLFHLIFRGWKYDLFYIWFADYHSLLPTLFAKITRKKTILVIGGYDACRLKGLNYGAFTGKLRGCFVKQSVINSTINLAVSGYIHRKLNVIAPGAPNKLIYNCVSFNEPPNNLPKENFILTVGAIDNERGFYLKGIDTFFDVARLLPEHKFMLIGVNTTKLHYLLKDAPKNVAIKDLLPHQQLAEYYQKAKIYCQLSRMESFCLTLAEAMYFNCFPVITNAGGMPEVAGGLGKVVRRDAQLIANLLPEMLLQSERIDFRNHIEQKFSVSYRKSQLNDALFQILK